MISIDAAKKVILEQVSPLPSEEVDLLQALGRILCEDIVAPWDLPGADNSAMDGYSFSHQAVQGTLVKVTGFIPAGMECCNPVPAGEAVKIMTGAPLPAGCDTVVPIEDVELFADCIRLKTKGKPGAMFADVERLSVQGSASWQPEPGSPRCRSGSSPRLAEKKCRSTAGR